MATKKELLDDLQIKIEEISFKYENIFIVSDIDLKKFFEENGSLIINEITLEATKTLHKGILSNIEIGDDFNKKVLELKSLGASKIHQKIVALSKL